MGNAMLTTPLAEPWVHKGERRPGGTNPPSDRHAVGMLRTLLPPHMHTTYLPPPSVWTHGSLALLSTLYLSSSAAARRRCRESHAHASDSCPTPHTHSRSHTRLVAPLPMPHLGSFLGDTRIPRCAQQPGPLTGQRHAQILVLPCHWSLCISSFGHLCAVHAKAGASVIC